MKRIIAAVLAIAVISLTSCDTTQEISINNDGTGRVIKTTDLGGLLGIAKMSGQGEKMEKMDRPLDTTVNLATMIDSIPDLSQSEKNLLSKGTLGVKINMEEDQFTFRLDFPFSKPGEIIELDKLSAKVLTQASKKQMGGNEEAGQMMGSESASPSLDEYFVTTYASGKIDRVLDKTKYATIEDNEMLKGMKEMASMGMGKTTTIFNLPSPAKKTSGSNVSVSADKKTVTIVTTLEDFYEDASKMEFHIEY